MRSILRFLFVLCLLQASTLAQAQEKTEVDVVLILALDVSDSVSKTNYAQQISGYAAAFTDFEVIQTITEGNLGKIGVTLVQWASDHQQAQSILWHVIGSADESYVFSQLIQDMPRAFSKRKVLTDTQISGLTSITGALRFSLKLMGNAPLIASRYVIDISGDGFDMFNSAGGVNPLLDQQRKLACDNGITINGLAIEEEPQEHASRRSKLNIEQYYKDHLICGAGAFVIKVEGMQNFARAVRRKLLLELVASND